MKKKMALVLILVLIVSNSKVAFGGTVSNSSGAESHDVTATYNSTTHEGGRYSIDITWGALDFTYTTSGSWDPVNHNYGTGGDWNHKTNDGTNTITVTNNSNAEVGASFSIADYNLLPNGVTLNIKEDDGTIIADATKAGLGRKDSVQSLATAANSQTTEDQLKREAYVTLDGAPTTIFTTGKIASVTVTIDSSAYLPG